MIITASRRVVITGSNSGIGKAAAMHFARQGHHVIMACRNLERSRPAQEEVKRAAGSEKVDLMEVDVSSFQSIAAFCTAYKERYDGLDILIHNAGYFEHGLTTYQMSADNLELTFASNVFGPLLMTEMFAGLLAKSTDPRILGACSTSIKNFFEPKRAIEFDNLRGEFRDSRKYSVFKMYADSKMGLLLLTYKLAEVYRARGIKVTALMIPATRLSSASLQKMRGPFRFIAPIIQNLNPWVLEPADIAACYYDICTADEFKEVTGVLVDAKKRMIQPAESQGILPPWKVAGELWNTRHTPAYANRPENIEKMWALGQEVIAAALART